MKVTGHCLVKNEERFIWYAVTSVIDQLDELLVWDHGSRDRTIEIIKLINNPKIKFRQVSGEVSELRQKMVEETSNDWIFILDGDEVWHERSVKELIKNLDNKYSCAVVPNYMLIGDIFHYQEDKAGKYRIGKVKGHYNIRAIKNTDNLKVEGVYPNEAFMVNGVKVQDLPDEKIFYFENPYLHASFLNRSSMDQKKIKYEIGEVFPKDYYYPEVFFKDRPETIPSVWESAPLGYKLRALVETPVKRLKRRII